MKNAKQLARLLHYILGRRPDEFGLVPNAEGYVAVKDLIKILHEEGWHHVRPHHLAALPYHLADAGIEIDDGRIRAHQRNKLPSISAGGAPPRELYTCIRRRAYTTTVANGLAPQGHPAKVRLFADIELARRVGRRRDADPLVVTVQTTVAQRAGIQFERFGEALYLAARIPADCCRLPAAPKALRAARTRQEKPPADPPPPAGSYTLDWKRLGSSAPPAKSSGRKSKQWRRERQRLRRMKRSTENST